MTPRSPSAAPPPERQRFHTASDTPADAAHARRLLQLLLAQDGSTTRLCETIAGGAVELHLVEQRVVDGLPPGSGGRLGGSAFIERITSLAAHGRVMMDNLSYIALDGLAADLRRDLEAGTIPIGHLLARMWVRREFVEPPPALCQRLWDAARLPDPAATRAYRIVTPEGPRMLIVETFRRGMRMGEDEAASL